MSVPALSQLSPSLPSLAPSPPPPPPQILTPAQSISFEQRKYKRPIEPIVAWTASISRHFRNGQHALAAAEFTRMRLAGVTPNYVTFITLLSGCMDFPPASGSFGPLIHGYAHKLGMDRDNVMVGTAVVDMYAKFGQLEPAMVVFNGMSFKNSITWNTMIDGLVKNGKIEAAVQLFDEMPERNAVSWTAMINGFVKIGDYEGALEWFRAMVASSVEPDYVTIIAVLGACANLGTLGVGLWLHKYTTKQDFKDNVRISNTLIDMYSRCGCIEFAAQVFKNMTKRTLVSWNSIIVGFAMNGCADEALEYFALMGEQGFTPNDVTFTGALTACSHAGLVEEGLCYFERMKRVYNIKPRIEHYGCMVDLHSRTGNLEEALNVIEAMPMKANEVILGSLLAACRSRGDVEFAERLMKYLEAEFDGDKIIDSNYILMSNTYAAVGKWGNASNMRNKMKAFGIEKKPGISSIEVGSCIHQFVSGDKSHVDTELIFETLHLLSFDSKFPHTGVEI